MNVARAFLEIIKNIFKKLLYFIIKAIRQLKFRINLIFGNNKLKRLQVMLRKILKMKIKF